MKLLSYCRMGETSFGIGKKDGVIDLGLRLKNKLPDKTISNFLSIFDFKYLERFANLSVDYFYSDIAFLPVIPNPNKIESIILPLPLLIKDFNSRTFIYIILIN